MSEKRAYGTAGTTEHVKFTEAFRRDLSSEPKLYLDTVRTGFAISVRSKDAKSYLCIRRVPGHGQVKYKFGNVGEYTIAEARKKAESILARMGEGHNPVAERREARAQELREKVRGVTLRQAVALTVATLKAKGRLPRTIDDFDDRRFEKYLGEWMDKPLADLTRAEVRQRHHDLAAEIARGKYAGGKSRGPEYGRVTANRIFHAFRAVYNRALREHPELPANPCVNIDWFQTKTKKKAIAPEQLPIWYAGVKKSDNAVRRDFLLFVLFSGLRLESAQTMRWEHVDFERKALHIPRPKGGEERAFDLPLSGFLIEILKRRSAEHDALCAGKEKMKPWVWPATTTPKPDSAGHIVEVREEIAGVDHWSPHDLRRTFITAATHWCRLHPYDVKLLVNHSLSGDVTEGYVTPSLENLRAPMQVVADKLRAACAPRAKAKVVRMRPRRAA